MESDSFLENVLYGGHAVSRKTANLNKYEDELLTSRNEPESW